MANTELSYADRLQRGRDMQTATVGFSPAFAPVDSTLGAASFLTFLDGLDTLNTEVGTLLGQYTTGVAQRTPMVEDIKDRSLRVLSLIKSNAVWKAFLPAIKSLVDKIRGNTPKPPKPPAPGESPGSPPAKKRNKGEQSFGDIETNFEKLIALLAGVPGYTPPAADLTVANLTTLANDFAAKNLAMSSLGNQLGMKQKARSDAYDGDTGLRARMKAIKEAVRSQYGSSSPEYEQVKGIAL